MIFGKGERRRTRRTSNENLTKSAKIAAFWQGSFYSWLASYGAAKYFAAPLFVVLTFLFFYSKI